MEVRRVEGNDLVKNVVYNIYKNEGNDNVGVCLVIGENNRNNRTIIRLRKLIGNDEISLIKSEIYGKKPVNLTGADLTGADLTGAVLTDAKLNFSKLTGATLIDATLTNANLTGSNLTGANLTGANISFSNLTLSNLTGAILTRVNLYITDLTDSNLTNANLTGATLTDATLTDAIISRNSLSESQTEEGTIFGQPKYIEDLSEEQLRQEQLRQEQRRQEQRRQEGQLENNNSNGEWNRNRRPQQRRRNSNNIISSNNNNNNSRSGNNRNILFDGNNLVENCVYNIYQNDGNVNVGVCLVISENNRNNGTRIRLRKLIGNTELSLIKSEIYGKIPVNLSHTDLGNADLPDADLTSAILIDSFLFGADLTGAFLNDAYLTDAILTRANLTGADLTGADLTGADLNNATIFRDSLSELQQQQIIGQPNYIERVRRIPPRQQRKTPIEIPENLLNPENKENNSCPNFNELYEFIMGQNLSGRFFFKYEGPNRYVIDVGGPKRDVFDKILPAYTKKFFKEIEDNEDYVILKEDVDMDTLIRETDQLILLASASETKIFLKIDPILLSLLRGNQFTYFNNNKRNRFSNLYKKFNQYIEHSNNNSQLLRNKNNSKLIETLKSENLKNEVLVKTLKQEIRFRRFAITRGFTNMEQFNKMAQFIRKFYYRRKSFITCKLKFDRETFVKRIKLFKKIKKDNFDNYTEEPIPLEQYVRLSQNNQSILILNRANDIIMNYPYLIPFLNFILGPESSDDDRKLFVVYVSGSSLYTGELTIYLSYKTHVKAGNIPYKSTTCEKYLELFKNKTQNRHSITADTIRIQLFSDTGFGRA